MIPKTLNNAIGFNLYRVDYKGCYACKKGNDACVLKDLKDGYMNEKLVPD